MKMHEKMHYWSNYNEKRLPKALKIDKKSKIWCSISVLVGSLSEF